jgi:MFS family permease
MDEGPHTALEANSIRTSRYLAVSVLTTVTAFLPVFLVGALAVELRQSLHFDSGRLGLAVSFYYLGAGVGSMPLSWITERIGGSRMMRIATAAGAILTALLATATSSWDTLASILGLCGVVGGAILPATYAFLARHARIDRQGLTFGINQAAVPLASLLGGVAVPSLALTLGWRWTFASAAVLSLITCFLIPSSNSSPKRTTRTRHADKGRRLTVAPLVLLSVGLGLGMFAANAVVAFLAVASVAVGFGKGAAGLVVAAGASAAAVVRIGAGIQADRRGKRHFPVVAAMLAVGAAGYVVLAAGSMTHSRWLFLGAAVVALGAGWGWNGLFIFAVVRTHSRFPARAIGIVDVGGRLGGVLGPLTVGLVIVHASYATAWIVAAAAAATASGAVLLGRHRLTASHPT